MLETGRLTMVHGGSWLSRAMLLLMVPLIAAPPALCCCWFGALTARASAVASAAGGGAGEDCCRETREPLSRDADGCGDGGSCGEDQREGCACPKPAVSSVDGGVAPAPAMPSPMLAWEPAWHLPEARAAIPERWSPLARPPPTSLSRLCVLRV